MTTEIKTKERPILFKGEMVLAYLDGTKTCTRRTRGLGIVNESPNEWELSRVEERFGSTDATFTNIDGVSFATLPCPYGNVGDRLWVRETWNALDITSEKMWTEMSKEERLSARWYPVYKVDEDPEEFGNYDGPYAPSIHMPRWASRIATTITKIGIERVGDITESDALAEGVAWEELEGGVIGYRDYRIPFAHCTTARESFKTLWNHVAGDDGRFDRNEWCWVIRFASPAGKL